MPGRPHDPGRRPDQLHYLNQRQRSSPQLTPGPPPVAKSAGRRFKHAANRRVALANPNRRGLTPSNALEQPRPIHSTPDLDRHDRSEQPLT